MLARILCVVLMSADLAAAGLLPRLLARYVPAATQLDAPLKTFTARDLPLQMGSATGALANRLHAFEPPTAPFDYTMQLIETDDAFCVYRLVFPSPYRSPFPQNNVVPAEYYLPRHVTAKVPAAIVLDIMFGNAIVPRAMARALASRGVAALYMPMAYYNQRRPKDDLHARWFDNSPQRAVAAIRQTVMDIRRAKAILSGRAEVDPSRIGITGVSLGGIMTAVAAGIDGGFYRVVPILSGGDLSQMIFHAPETRKFREKMVESRVDPKALESMMQLVEPLDYAARIDPERCLMINAENDQVIPRDCTMQLWKAIGKPTLLWLPSGHYTAGWYLPTIEQTAVDFLSGKPVHQLEF